MAVLGSLVSVHAEFIGGLRAGLVIVACAFLAGAAVTLRGVRGLDPGTGGSRWR